MDHGLALTGLGDDDHTQYAHLSQDEQIIGDWDFPATGFTIGDDGRLERGAADRLDLATGDSFRIVSGDLELGSDVVLGRGAANRLDVGVGDSLSVDSDTLFVDASNDKVRINAGITDPTYSAALVVRFAATDVVTNLIHKFTSQTAYLWEVRDSDGTLFMKVTADGDLESGDFYSGLVGWAIDHTGTAEFNNCFVRGELHATIFVADEFHATGGTFIVLTSFKVADPISAGDNVLPALNGSFTLVVQASWDLPGATPASYIADDDLLRLKYMGEAGAGIDLWDIYLEVNGTPSSNGDRDLANGEPGTHDVNCILRMGGSSGEEIPAGTGGVVWGKVQQSAGTYTGAILMTSDLNYAPYIDIFTVDADESGAWSGVPPDITPRARLGNLDGVLGLSEEWGLAAGTDLTDSTAPHIIMSDQQVSLYDVDLAIYDGANQRIGLDASATGTASMLWVGESTSTKYLDLQGDGQLWVSTLAIAEDLGEFFFTRADGLLMTHFEIREDGAGDW